MTILLGPLAELNSHLVELLTPFLEKLIEGWVSLVGEVGIRLGISSDEEHTRDAIDPLEGLLEVIKSGRSGRVATTLWLELKPLKRKEAERAKRNSRLLASHFPVRSIKNSFERNFSSVTLSQRMKLWSMRRVVRPGYAIPSEVKTKLEQHLFSATITVETVTDQPNPELHRRKLDDIESALSLFTGFSAVFFVEMRPRGSFLLSAPEIATLWHIPTIENKVPRLERQAFKEFEPPR